MLERLCCANCFGDRQIREQYIHQCFPVVGTCNYCGSVGVQCVRPQSLRQWIDTLFATYEVAPDRDGEPIVDLMIREWGMFHGSGLDPIHAKELLADVLDDGEIVRKSFFPILNSDEANLQIWENLRHEMMHKNRWFPSMPMDMARIEYLLEQLITPASALIDLRWYRARLLGNKEKFTREEMQAPPPGLAGHGRANPAGIPYLYLGSTRSTAVSEIRPHAGEYASVAEFKLNPHEFKFADLRDPRGTISPLIGDESEIIRLRADLPLLERLGEELTRPVQSSAAPYEYIPTQFLCEFIKKCGFDGVLYRSSVSNDKGINLAMFNPSQARITDIKNVKVERVNVDIVL